jgi:tetratricopeptide (TPR) repeat protein
MSPRLVIAIVLALGLAAPAQAYAQAGERAATAEDLFRQALQLTKRGRFAEACPKFAESHRLDPAYGSLINLAACYEKTGRTASAWQAYVDAADLARDKGQRARADSARKKAGQLAPRLVRLELRLGAGVEARALAITRNDRPFDLALLGNAVPVDPGNHTIIAARAGVEPWKTSVSATAPGKTTVVEIAGPVGHPPPVKPVALPTSPAPPAAAPGPGTPSRAQPAAGGVTLQVREAPPEGPHGRGLRRAGKTLAVTGVTLAALGGALGLLSRSISSDYTNIEMGERFEPALEERAKLYETSAIVLWSASAAALVSGVTVYLIGRGRDERPTVAVVPASQGASALVSWRW